jgi:hypothetical protein
MRADVVAAMFDFESSRELFHAADAGDAPRPTGWRGRGRRREPIWVLDEIQKWISERYLAATPLSKGLEHDIVIPNYWESARRAVSASFRELSPPIR